MFESHQVLSGEDQLWSNWEKRESQKEAGLHLLRLLLLRNIKRSLESRRPVFPRQNSNWATHIAIFWGLPPCICRLINFQDPSNPIPAAPSLVATLRKGNQSPHGCVSAPAAPLHPRFGVVKRWSQWLLQGTFCWFNEATNVGRNVLGIGWIRNPEWLRAKQPLWACWRAMKREYSRPSHFHKSTKPSSNKIGNLRTKEWLSSGNHRQKWWKIYENPLSFSRKSNQNPQKSTKIQPNSQPSRGDLRHLLGQKLQLPAFLAELLKGWMQMVGFKGTFLVFNYCWLILLNLSFNLTICQFNWRNPKGNLTGNWLVFTPKMVEGFPAVPSTISKFTISHLEFLLDRNGTYKKP